MRQKLTLWDELPSRPTGKGNARIDNGPLLFQARLGAMAAGALAIRQIVGLALIRG